MLMPNDESLANLTKACDNFHRTLDSFGKTTTLIYVVLALFILVGTFALGVEIGKTMCS